MTNVAEFRGGPANGRRRVLEERAGWPAEVTVAAAEFQGHVDAIYVFGQGAHSVGTSMDAEPWIGAYRYRLPSGELDDGPDQLDPNEEEQRKLVGRNRSALQSDGTVLVWYADGPFAGTSDKWSVVQDEHAADNVDVSQHPLRTAPYRGAGRLEVRGGVSYDVYLYNPEG